MIAIAMATRLKKTTREITWILKARSRHWSNQGSMLQQKNAPQKQWLASEDQNFTLHLYVSFWISMASYQEFFECDSVVSTLSNVVFSPRYIIIYDSSLHWNFALASEIMSILFDLICGLLVSITSSEVDETFCLVETQEYWSMEKIYFTWSEYWQTRLILIYDQMHS